MTAASRGRASPLAGPALSLCPRPFAPGRAGAALACALAALLLSTSPAQAADKSLKTTLAFATSIVGKPAGQPLHGTELAQRTEVVARQVRCPVCQGSSINDSPSSTARDMKAEVRELLAAGYTEEQTISYFVASYGDFIRLKPKDRGFDALVWVAPPLLFLVGALLTALWLRKRSRASGGGAPPPPEVPLDPDDPALSAYLVRVRALADDREDPTGET